MKSQANLNLETVDSLGSAFVPSAYFELTKPRVTLMVTLTAAVGFYLGSSYQISLILLANTLLGTAMLSAGTAVLNQFMERKADALMRRTANRPIPTRTVSAGEALVFGMGLVSLGTIYLLATTNALTALLGWLTSAVYLLVYTPLKTRHPICTTVGAIPGSVPPLMGWAAASGSLDLDALIVFGILFTWQFPHFLAIAWIYREDYRRGGFKMLPENDPRGVRTSRRILVFSVLLLGLSVVPTLSGLTGVLYLLGAIALGGAFGWYSFQLSLSPSKISARRVLKASVAYLPSLLILMSIDKF